MRFGEFLILPRRFRRVHADVRRLVGRRGRVVGVLLIGDDSVGYPMAAVLSLEVGVLPFHYVDNVPRVQPRKHD